LRGVVVGPGFRARLRALAGPGHPATLSFSLLDQLPGAAFLVGYTLMADNPPTQDSPAARARFATRVDQCAGFTATGTIGTWITTVGHSPVPRGPRPPELAEPGAAGWHELPPLRPLSFRRARRLDVRRAAGRAEVAEVAAMFRDISVGRDGEPTVLHEYSLRATVDVARRTVVAATAQPRVLPWQECPAAAASARRVAGVALADLRRWVPAQLSGPSTCTHLNEALRALADVEHLLDWDPAGRERQSGP
ncbi:MAG: DUF2889 domain-containing protein, partial [Frankia sp.]|nr:DUF2889 domain-containing protein [Frankia sp.]